MCKHLKGVFCRLRAVKSRAWLSHSPFVDDDDIWTLPSFLDTSNNLILCICVPPKPSESNLFLMHLSCLLVGAEFYSVRVRGVQPSIKFYILFFHRNIHTFSLLHQEHNFQRHNGPLDIGPLLIFTDSSIVFNWMEKSSIAKFNWSFCVSFWQWSALSETVGGASVAAALERI